MQTKLSPFKIAHVLKIAAPILKNSWTADAPYRETETAISAKKVENVAFVEMEASALYAFAQAK
ncbi:MAG: hypothetical protein Q8O62_14165 [Aequorivita sp.]|nr:hypothetical protein [Aequorivita sp.]